MAKRLKLRIFRLIPIFQSCRSRDPSALPLDPHPIFFRPTTINNNKIDTPAIVPGPPPPKPHHSSLKRHVSSVFIAVGCGFRSKSSRQHHSSDDNAESAEYKWKQDDKWHVIARVQDNDAPPPRRKIHNSSVSSGTDADVSPSPPLPAAADLNKNKRSNKKKICKPRVRISTSSGDSGWFSSEGGEDDDDGEETETLVSSSRSITTDCSSDFNPHLETISESPTNNGSNPKKNKKKPRRVRRVKRKGAEKGKMCPSPGTETPARLSVLQRLIPCTMDGKVRESFAIIKRSEDPYEDFKRSMLEMIVEKQMFEESDLEQLLHCFLSLNSRQHHGVIVEAFSEIWETLFCKSPGSQSQSYQVSEAP